MTAPKFTAHACVCVCARGRSEGRPICVGVLLQHSPAEAREVEIFLAELRFRCLCRLYSRHRLDKC